VFLRDKLTWKNCSFWLTADCFPSIEYEQNSARSYRSIVFPYLYFDSDPDRFGTPQEWAQEGLIDFKIGSVAFIRKIWAWFTARGSLHTHTLTHTQLFFLRALWQWGDATTCCIHSDDEKHIPALGVLRALRLSMHAYEPAYEGACVCVCGYEEYVAVFIFIRSPSWLSLTSAFCRGNAELWWCWNAYQWLLGVKVIAQYLIVDAEEVKLD